MADRSSPWKMRASVGGQLKDGAMLARTRGRVDVVMTVPLAFGKGSAKTAAGRQAIRTKLRQTASGEWDRYFRDVGRALVDGGYPDAVIRLGHEFTGSWYPWSSQGNAREYIAAFRHIHGVLTEASPQFRFDWNASRNTFAEYGPDAYPGDRYVDIVSMDVYYEPWKGDREMTDSYWRRRYEAPLTRHLAFAQAHGKPVAYPEWAVGDVDLPEYIDRMHGWFESLPTRGAGSLVYQSYFNAPKAIYDLDQRRRTRARYVQLFRDGSSPAPSPPPTTIPLPEPSGETPAVSVRSASASEGDKLVFRFDLSAPATQDVQVQVKTADGTATATVDYRPISTTVVIETGATRAWVAVRTLVDQRVEPNETVKLRIVSASGATIATKVATGTITR